MLHSIHCKPYRYKSCSGDSERRTTGRYYKRTSWGNGGNSLTQVIRLELLEMIKKSETEKNWIVLGQVPVGAATSAPAVEQLEAAGWQIASKTHHLHSEYWGTVQDLQSKFCEQSNKGVNREILVMAAWE